MMRYIFGLNSFKNRQTAGRSRIKELFFHELSSPAELFTGRYVFDGKDYQRLSFLSYFKKLYQSCSGNNIIEVYNNHFLYILTLRIIFYKSHLRWHYVEYRSAFSYKWYQIYHLINAKLVDTLAYIIVDECIAITQELADKQAFKSVFVIPPLYQRKTKDIPKKYFNSIVFSLGKGYSSQLKLFLNIVHANPSWRFSLITPTRVSKKFPNLTIFNSLSDDNYEMLLCRHQYGLVVMDYTERDLYRYPNKIAEYVNCGVRPIVLNPNPAIQRDLGYGSDFSGIKGFEIIEYDLLDQNSIYTWERYRDILK
jgi:hypothetical protein